MTDDHASTFSPTSSLSPLRLLSSETAARIGLRRSVLVVCGVLLVSNLLLAFSLLRTPPQTVVVVPPETGFSGELGTSLKTAYKVDEKGPDARLLERTALTLVQMVATITPETSSAQLRAFLEHVDPAITSELSMKLDRELKSMAEDNASAVFYPFRVKTDREALTVTVTGKQKTLIGPKVVADRKTTWRMTFRHAAGRLYLTALDEDEAGEP